MGKLFLDVGGHHGQTVMEVARPIYNFDAIHCFEPLSANGKVIRRRFGHLPNLKLHDFGLSDQTGSLVIYERSAGDMGASVKRRADDDASGIETKCEFAKASDFFRDHIADGDMVIMKLNCEGSECDILHDLIESGEIFKVRNVMIDFDVRKFPHLAEEEEKLLARMKEVGFHNYSIAEIVMKGRTHQQRIANWLRSLPSHEDFRAPLSIAERLGGWKRSLRAAIKSVC